MSNELTTTAAHLPDTQASVDIVSRRLAMIRELMKKEMHEGIDFGMIPGTQGKPTLHKPGAEKLVVLFRLDVQMETKKTWLPDDHLVVESKCTIDSKDASAICSTKESKYAYRRAERVCPKCSKPAIIKGKAEYGGGWLCFKKKDGCGAKFADADPAITGQTVGRLPNTDIPDSWNTVVRIAEKRAFVAAARLATGASSLFDEETPDQERVEDDGEIRQPTEPEQPQPLTLPQWKTALQEKLTPDALNVMLPQWKAIEDEPMRKQVGKLIGARAKADGMVWDGEASAYVASPLQSSAAVAHISGEQCIDLAGLLERAAYPIEDFLKDYQIKALGELPAVHWTAAKGMLEGMIQNRKMKAAAST